ncbi:cellulose synthase complex periplasmic endoglucanase BcsZ [Pseudomonas entomophila]|uniref:cellulose synthase complex periplasmic endoglucanase BcsZ n=1 Tax=Pseudomonas entomophila TaxID=312306 RepID=UPI0023D84838|nr:cellulose synthase complex periplasmic endoglucanase BcsZ [Pseudomonas entomophila]MDF0734247.1 cellulose synthase complex periplasmic endoglucanase BcsZ [Pseudomonas entomophila]
MTRLLSRALLALLLLTGLPVQAACEAPWALWQTFAQRWVQEDGRVLESSLKPNHSTSEGQSYALFFALVGNDRARFERIWRWSRENLAGNDPGKMLPGWLWGQGADGQWQVRDANAASDADLWFAYALLEADRLWKVPAYRADALALLGQVKAREVAELPGLGATLLPGPVGFAQPDHLWRLNPSYVPLPVLRRLAKADPKGPWAQVLQSSVKLLREGGANGFAADWVGYRATSDKTGVFTRDATSGDLGSYDAIRVYLWAGMTDPKDPHAAAILAALGGMSAPTASSGVPPEKVAVASGAVEGSGPFGFSAALVPYFRALNQPWLADLQERRARRELDAALQAPRDAKAPPVYYNYMLSLFGLGWSEQRYRFAADGQLKLSWESECSAKAP